MNPATLRAVAVRRGRIIRSLRARVRQLHEENTLLEAERDTALADVEHWREQAGGVR